MYLRKAKCQCLVTIFACFFQTSSSFQPVFYHKHPSSFSPKKNFKGYCEFSPDVQTKSSHLYALERDAIRFRPPARRTQQVLRQAVQVPDQLITSLSVNAVWPVVATILNQKSLTTGGLINAALLGLILWGSLGWQGWSVAVVYLIFGSAVTKVKMAEKEKLGIAEARGGRRGPENVWGSALTGAICAIAAACYPDYTDLLQLGFVASFATKLSDTFGSEIGKAYGKTTYLITTLKPVPKGTEGAVSLEGTLAGIVGSIILAAWGVLVQQIGMYDVLPTLIAAFLACNVESFLGATTQGKSKYLTNETINFVNTLVGASFAMAIRVML